MAKINIATEILALRRDRMSSVSGLIAAMDWRDLARHNEIFLSRDYAVLAAADTVLLNVAVHAIESQWEGDEVTRTSPEATQTSSEATQTLPEPSRNRASRRRWPRWFGTRAAQIHATS